MLAYVCTWLFVFAIPWENIVVIPGLGTISRILGIGAFGATVMRVLLEARVRRLVQFHWVAFAFFCWVLLSVFWAVNTTCMPGKLCDVPLTISTYLQLFLMLWVIWEATPTPSRLTHLLQAYVLGACVAAAATIHSYVIGTGTEKAVGRFAASGFDANDLGMMMTLALPMAWYLASIAPRAALRWVNRGYFVIGIVAILLTGSRGAMLATIVALSVIPWTLTHLRRSVRVGAVIIMIGAGVAGMVFVPAASFERLSTTSSEISEGSWNARLGIWKTGFQVVPARPLHGYGPAGWRRAVSHRFGIKGAHNTYLAILVDEGLIGLLLYLSMFALVLRGILVLPTFDRRVGLTLLATLIVALTPLDWDTKKQAWVLLGLLVSFAQVLAPGRRGGEVNPTARAPGYGQGPRQPVRMARRVGAK